MSDCNNCDQTLTGDFCANCGQKNINLQRPMGQLLAELIRETFDVDGRLSRTLWTLFRWPGRLTSDYIQGRRKRYTSPLRLYLVLNVLFFLVVAWAAGKGILLGEGQTLDSDAPEQVRFLADQLPRLMLILLPAFALLLKIAFRQQLYIDHLIHALHLHCSAYTVLAVILPLERIATLHWQLLVVQIVGLSYLLAAFVISLRQVYAARWSVTVGKAACVFLAYLALLAISPDILRHLTTPGLIG